MVRTNRPKTNNVVPFRHQLPDVPLLDDGVGDDSDVVFKCEYCGHDIDYDVLKVAPDPHGIIHQFCSPKCAQRYYR
jgi:hypothetical protein